jgi:hypothetical protein
VEENFNDDSSNSFSPRHCQTALRWEASATSAEMDVISSPVLSRPPSSIFDDNEIIKGWASGSSYTTECSLPSRLRGRRKKAQENVRDDGTEDEETDVSPTFGVFGKRADSRVGKAGEAQMQTTRAPRRTRSDPLKRANTPPSVHRGEPNRPQSAMKHKSANKYSSRKDDSAMIIITSINHMPKRESSVEADSLSMRPTASEVSANEDADAFSPGKSGRRVKYAKYVLCARAGLPKDDFYEQVKREEGSPTPETRR